MPLKHAVGTCYLPVRAASRAPAPQLVRFVIASAGRSARASLGNARQCAHSRLIGLKASSVPCRVALQSRRLPRNFQLLDRQPHNIMAPGPAVSASVAEVAAVLLTVPALLWVHEVSCLVIRSRTSRTWQFVTTVPPTLAVLLGHSPAYAAAAAGVGLLTVPFTLRFTKLQPRDAMLGASLPRARWAAHIILQRARHGCLSGVKH